MIQDTQVVCLVDFKIANSRVAGSPTPGGTCTIIGADGATITLITT